MSPKTHLFILTLFHILQIISSSENEEESSCKILLNKKKLSKLDKLLLKEKCDEEEALENKINYKIAESKATSTIEEESARIIYANCRPSKIKGEACQYLRGDSYTSKVVFDTNGRLGNKMGAFASAFGVRKSPNFEGFDVMVYRNLVDELSIYFKNLSCILPIVEDEICDPCSYDWLHLRMLMNSRLEQRKKFKTGLTFANMAYPNFVGLYKKHLDNLRTIFVLKDEFVHEAKDYLKNLGINKENGGKLVAVHVRRSDFKEVIMRNHGAKSASMKYFQTAMDHFRKKYNEKVQFLIFGDDPLWIRRKFKNIPDATIIKHEEDSKKKKEDILGLDLALIYSCDDVIMSHGTFGIWAGIMVGGEVIMADSKTTKGALEEVWKMKKANLNGWTFLEDDGED